MHHALEIPAWHKGNRSSRVWSSVSSPDKEFTSDNSPPACWEPPQGTSLDGCWRYWCSCHPLASPLLCWLLGPHHMTAKQFSRLLVGFLVLRMLSTDFGCRIDTVKDIFKYNVEVHTSQYTLKQKPPISIHNPNFS